MSNVINIPIAQMREAAAAWRKHDRGNVSLHDRIGEFIDEIERLRELLRSPEMHVHPLPDGGYTAAAAGPSHPLKDHGIA
jgi:hypothetical protein